jgi:toxin ParE1/3/4
LNAKRVVLREAAERDIESATAFYVRRAGRPVGVRFLNEVDRSLTSIGASPSIGSPHYAHQLGLAGLRARLLRRFPFLIFYMEEHDHVDVWRVLHAQRDIPAELGGADE